MLNGSLRPSTASCGGKTAPVPLALMPTHFTCEQMESLLAPRGLRHFSPLDDYKQGGMSLVYECLDTAMNQRRVVKIPNRLDEQTCERFACEADILTKITDRRIVRLYGYGMLDAKQPDGRVLLLPYCVMEFVDGRSMESCLSSPGRIGEPPALNGPVFTLKEKLHVAIECCLAMHTAHTQGDGILHRDLKPSNIMIVGYGESLTVKILDFGIAYLPGTSSGHTHQCTERYAAPEQKSSDGTVTVMTDVYLLGGTLRDWFTGRGDISKRWPTDLPPLLEKVLNQATARQQHERHQSMEEFRARLEEVLQWVEEAEQHPLHSLEEEALLKEKARSWPERLADRPALLWGAVVAVAAASLIWLGWLWMLFVVSVLCLLVLPRRVLSWQKRVAVALFLLSTVPLAYWLGWFGLSHEELVHRWQQIQTHPQRVRVELAGLELSPLAKEEAFITQLVVEWTVVINGQEKRMRTRLLPQIQLPDAWINQRPGKWPHAVSLDSAYALEFEGVVPNTDFMEVREGKLIDDEIIDDDLGSFSFTRQIASLQRGGLVTTSTVGGDSKGRYSGSALTFRVSAQVDGEWLPLSAPK